MAPTTTMKAVYAAVVLLVQIYFVYAATLYVEVWSRGFMCVLGAAVASAAGAGFYLFRRADEDEQGGRDVSFTLDERRRIG